MALSSFPKLRADHLTARALRRSLAVSADEFPNDVAELLDYFSISPAQPVHAVPGMGLRVPVWILGSSLFGARLAAAFGLPYAFASHFAPAQMMEAIDQYRSHFRASPFLEKPYVMLGFNVVAADSDEEAQMLATSAQQAFVNLRTGRPSRLPPPVRGYMQTLDPPTRGMLEQILSCSAIGSPASVDHALKNFISQTGADELMISSRIFEHAARLYSYEIAARTFQ